jgi:uncharacterized membrane protein
MSRLQKIFISGLVAFLPLALSVYVITAGIALIENMFGNFLRQVLPYGTYIPGFGFLTVIFFILALGFLVDNFITAAFFRRAQEKLREIPLIKIIYSPLRDLMNLFAKGQGQQSMQKVVLVHFSKSYSVIGLVTRESFLDLEPKLMVPKDRIAVYIPMSYGLGGYTVLVNKTDVEAVDMPIEKAMSLALTGWIQTDPEPKKDQK